MTVVPTTFPARLVYEIRAHIEAYYQGKDPSVFVLSRPLRPSDISRSVAVKSATRRTKTWQIGATAPMESIYGIEIQSLVKHMLEEEGSQEHDILTNELTMLAEQRALMTTLGQLTSSFGGYSERPQKLQVVSTDFHANEIPGNWLFASFMVVEITTERF